MRRNRTKRPVAALAAALVGLSLLGCGAGKVEKGIEPVFLPPAKREAAPLPPPPAPPREEKTTSSGLVRQHYPPPGFAATPSRFTWYRFPGAVSYGIIVLNGKSEILYESPRVAANMSEPPAGWEAALEEGICFWQVLAYGVGGERVGRSPLRDFVRAP